MGTNDHAPPDTAPATPHPAGRRPAHPGAFTRATGRSLEDSSGQEGYRRYQFDLIAPHCGPSVLEVGSGAGEFAGQFRGLDRLVLTDVDPDAVAALQRRFAGRAEVVARVLDVDGAGGSGAIAEAPVSSVVAINVLEHIEDDVAALRRLAGAVTPGGSIVLWVPAYPALYGDFDRAVGHFRRYTPRTLRAVGEAAGLRVERCHPVNLLGGIAWWAAVRVLGVGLGDEGGTGAVAGGAGAPGDGSTAAAGRAGRVKARLVAVYDRVVVPVTRALERLGPPPFGQSVLCVLRTPR